MLQLAAATIYARPIESYSESLLVRRVSAQDLAFRFEFVHRKQDSLGSGGAPQYETFPKLIDQMVSSNVSEVHLVLTRGKWLWRSETMWPSVESGSPGAEIWAETKNPETDWPLLIRSLAGLTCASLDMLDFNAIGKVNRNVVFAHLPSETVCVENLAPFLKLLPCRHEAGLGSLISAKSIVREARYYSMAITMRRKHGVGIELIQSLSVVLPIKPNLREIFPNVQHVKQCGNKPMTVVVESTGHRIRPAAAEFTESVSVWELGHHGLTGLDTLQVYKSTVNIQVNKWQTGTGSLHGRISTELTCNTPHVVQLKHVEFLPHFLQPRMKTLQVIVGSHTLSKFELRNALLFTSGDGKGSPGHFTFFLNCSSVSGERILITYEFDKMFLFYAQYPPNPNRGFDVPSSITLFNRTITTDEVLPAIWKRTHIGPVRVASEALLVYLAHPDFSMPYNVITLSSTGFAIFLGMIVNISVRGRGDIWAKKKKTFWQRWKQ